MEFTHNLPSKIALPLLAFGMGILTQYLPLYMFVIGLVTSLPVIVIIFMAASSSDIVGKASTKARNKLSNLSRDNLFCPLGFEGLKHLGHFDNPCIFLLK